MMKLRIDGFDWDDGNYAKCQKHGLSISEIEQFFRTDFKVFADHGHSLLEKRFIAVGRSSKRRPILVGFTFRKLRRSVLLRPITARFMHRREVEIYEKKNSKV